MIHVTLYTSPTCIPCHLLTNQLKALASTNSSKMTFETVDTMKENPLNIMGTPHAVVMKDDEEVYNDHVSNLAQFVSMIRGYLA